MERLSSAATILTSPHKGSIRPGAYVPTGFQMIREIDIRNFRCFEHLPIGSCQRVNIIVGENGVGKTALLEAIFLALATTTDIGIRYRQIRGLDGNFRGSTKAIADAVIGDLFHNFDTNLEVLVQLSGDGPEARSFRLFKGESETRLPLEDSNKAETSGFFHFVWRDSKGREYDKVPVISRAGFQFPETGEGLENFFYFGANAAYSSTENADRFSKMSRAKRQQEFIDLFKNQYDWVEDISIEVAAGQPALYVSIVGMEEKVALANVSSGINRIATILLGMASGAHSVCLVDELENGLYYKHHQAYWKSLLSFVRNFDSQLFVTTHSAEWLSALVNAAGEETNDISLWRFVRGEKNGQPDLFKFEGKDLRAGIEYGAELRGGAE
jgi:AAA domain, putative AbiEii toxin, Type IV TA system